MKHLTWGYKGYNDLKLDFQIPEMQHDWNATILTKFNGAFGDGFEDGMNLFVSEKIIDNILKTIVAYDKNSNTLFNKRVIKLDIDTPKIYVTNKNITDFTMIEHGNHGSVTIKNY